VFSEQTGGRIDIVEEPLQLQVQPYKDGFSIRSNIDTNNIHYDYCVTEQGDKQITVTHVSGDQLKILKLLRNISVFPAESKSRLTAMLQDLSSDFTVMSPLMKNATDLKRVEASPLIAVQIAPDEDQEFSIHLAVKPFGDNPPYQKPGKGMEIVSTTIDGERVQTERDMAAESRNETTVTAILSRLDGDQIDDNHWLLRRILSPFLLRRTKEDVLNELPEKTDITLRVELSEEEKALYDNLRQQAIANLEEGSNNTLQALAEITRLRQAACHPRLVNAKLDIPSSKTQAFLELVANLRESGHRALVFSQFTSHLALVREELDKTGIPYLYLDGSTTAQVRSKLVKQFQTGDEPLFLISLKAGGLGLNLTAADYVIHLDPWWNPAIEDQASDRAHRIGQQRPVTVYRLIAAGTIEEKILRLHQNKRSMADALLQDADLFNQISADDVIRLLRETVDNL
jgi:hypothetical protein